MARDETGDYRFNVAPLDDKDITKILFMITNMSGTNDEYKGGEYVGIIRHEDTSKPPVLMILTPNGFCQTGTENICISISKYHSNSYNPSLGWLGYLKNFVGTMIMWEHTGHGIGLLYNAERNAKHEAKHDDIAHCAEIDKQRRNIARLAKLSADYNKKNLKRYLDILNADLCDEIAEEMDALAIEEANRKRAEENRRAKLAGRKNRFKRTSKLPNNGAGAKVDNSADTTTPQSGK